MSERNPGNATRASFLSGPSSSASAIAQHYDAIVAERYDSETQGSRVIHACREMALDQIRSRPELDVGSVLDLGTGTGSLLAELHEMFPGAELVGVDSSEGMLAIARRKFGDGPVRWIRDDLENAGRHLPSESFDLVSLHFVLAYVDHEKAVHAARDALKPGGTLSLVTCTSDSFRTCMKYALRHYPEVADVVPSSHEGAVELLTSAGFSVIEERVSASDFHFQDFDELYRFGHDGGWFTTRSMTGLSRWIRFMFKMTSLHEFPLDEELRVSILLCKRL